MIAGSHQQPNLHLLPSFPTQDLCPDGKFLTPVAGLHYMLHIFDQSQSLLTRATLTSEVQLAQVQEQVRHHEDRVSYLENRHGGLQRQTDSKIAVDAEFDDWMRNKNDEDWIVIKGLPHLTNVTRQEWPNAVKKQVANAAKLVLQANRARLDFEVLHVSNPFRPTNTGPTTYNVQMDSAYTSKRLRDLFSGFFRHHHPVARPPGLKGVSFRNKITLETKIRIAILRQLGSIYKASNPGSQYDVQGYGPRPLLVTVPPRSSTDRKRTYSFIQAVNTLPATFNDENLTLIYQVIGDRFRGKLQSLFVVLSDDDHDRCLELVRNSDRNSGRRPPQVRAAASGSIAATVTDAITTFAQVHGPGSGMELESQLVDSLRHPPPPPDHRRQADLISPKETEASRAHDERVRQRRREHERQPTPEEERRGLKRNHLSSFSVSEADFKSKKAKKSRKGHHKSSRHSRRSPSESSTSGSTSSSGSRRARKAKRKRSHRSRRSPSDSSSSGSASGASAHKSGSVDHAK